MLLDDLEIKSHQRDNIFNIQSLVHNQFSAPRFQPFILYAWYKSDYLTHRPEVFITPSEFFLRMFLNVVCCIIVKTILLFVVLIVSSVYVLITFLSYVIYVIVNCYICLSYKINVLIIEKIFLKNFKSKNAKTLS